MTLAARLIDAITCRVCGTHSSHTRYAAKEMMFGTGEAIEYFMCSDCGCLQIASIPSQLSRYYPADYYSFQGRQKPRPYKPYPRAVLERFRVGYALFGRGRILDELAAYFVDYPAEWYSIVDLLKPCGVRSWNTRFLDIGCGSYSWWLESLRSLGFRELTGIDPQIQRDVSYDGIRIQKAHIGDVAGSFDVITMHHSLEHIPNQAQTLDGIRALLSADGVCVLRVPLVASTVWDMYGTDWVELDAPRHLYLHSAKSVELLATRAGLKLVHMTWDSTAFEFYGSEQYRRGIPLTAENSFATNPEKSTFTYSEMARFAALAEQANREGRGGRGCFYLRHAHEQ
jgi:SAM-dependent methyltransferase